MKALKPEIIEMDAQNVATLTSKGDPNIHGKDAFEALHGSVYTLKFDLKKQGKETFKVGGLRARWPDAFTLPKNEWTAHWALPIPQGIKSLPQKVQKMEVKCELWKYGTVAQILHIGPYDEEDPSIEKLRQFIEENNYEIIGDHEEEYLTSPRAKVQKTIIRYRVKNKS